MKERRLFEGELADRSIEGCMMELIGLSKQIGEDVFLRWNGMTLRISEKDTPEGLMQEYDQQCHAAFLLSMEYNGDLIKVDELALKLAKGIKKFLKD